MHPVINIHLAEAARRKDRQGQRAYTPPPRERYRRRARLFR
jgi:hypothetical protein